MVSRETLELLGEMGSALLQEHRDAEAFDMHARFGLAMLAKEIDGGRLPVDKPILAALRDLTEDARAQRLAMRAIVADLFEEFEVDLPSTPSVQDALRTLLRLLKLRRSHAQAQEIITDDLIEEESVFERMHPAQVSPDARAVKAVQDMMEMLRQQRANSMIRQQQGTPVLEESE